MYSVLKSFGLLASVCSVSMLDALGVEQRLGDLADANAIRTACAGVDAVLHNAAKAGQWGSRDSYFSANVTGTDNVIAACRAHHIHRLVYTSTPSVTHSGRTPVEGGNEANTPYGEHFKAWYPASKKLAEQRLLAANDGTLATVALRPRLIWGPGDSQLLPRLVDRAVAGRLRFVGDGENRMPDRGAPEIGRRAVAGRLRFVGDGENRMPSS